MNQSGLDEPNELNGPYWIEVDQIGPNGSKCTEMLHRCYSIGV